MSVLNNRTPDWIIYHEVVQTTKIYMREITVIESGWLQEIAPHFYDVGAKSQKHMESLSKMEDSNKDNNSNNNISSTIQGGVIHRSVF